MSVIRFTRRGLAFLALLALGLAGLGFWMGTVSRSAQYLPTHSVVVRSGDTLWSIAEQQMGAPGNVADQVQRIRQINQLEGSSLVPGDVLYVPLE